MKLIVGLGNPGSKYDNTRHNIGFMVLDAIAAKLGVTLSNRDFNGEFFVNPDFILAKPHTFMNLSGNFVLEVAKYYKVAPQDILVVRDDLDTPLGQAKLRLGGSAGGHNGMRHINEVFASTEIAQLKIGIGRPAAPNAAIAHYVLTNFTAAEQQLVSAAVAQAADAAISCIYNGYRTVMNHFNYKGKKR